LLEAVSSFTGTVIFVSHDRYFIDRVATRVFEVEGGHMHVYPGNYEDYLYRKENGQIPSGALPSSNGFKPVVEASPEPIPEPAKEVKEVKRLNPIKLKQMQDRFWFLEEEIPRLESTITATEAALGNYSSTVETQRLSRELGELREKQAAFTGEWEELMGQIEEQSALT
jgi:ATP-binding cassette subfamily F protein 3